MSILVLDCAGEVLRRKAVGVLRRDLVPYNCTPQEVSVFEDCNSARVSGHVNKTVSQETVS